MYKLFHKVLFKVYTQHSRNCSFMTFQMEVGGITILGSSSFRKCYYTTSQVHTPTYSPP